LPSEHIQIITNEICHSGAPRRGTVFEG